MLQLPNIPTSEHPEGSVHFLCCPYNLEFSSCGCYVIVYLSIVLIKVLNMDYGMEDKNPVDHVFFYSKNNTRQTTKIFKEQVTG